MSQVVFYFHRDGTEDEASRIAAAMREINERGTYELDLKELIYGAKAAWRNAVRCIGRIQWNKLQVSVNLFSLYLWLIGKGRFQRLKLLALDLQKHICFGQ